MSDVDITMLFIAIYSMHTNGEKCKNAVSVFYNNAKRSIEISQS